VREREREGERGREDEFVRRWDLCKGVKACWFAKSFQVWMS